MPEKISKTAANSLIKTMKIVSNEHLNPNGILFGGYLMCWIDEVAYMCARRYSGTPLCATVNIDNISFRAPHRLGEHLLLSARVISVGRTSMEIQVNVEIEGLNNEANIYTNSAYLTFVCTDENRRPVEVPRLILESEEDQKLFWESKLRVKVRKRLSRFLENKIKSGFSPNKKTQQRDVQTSETRNVLSILNKAIDKIPKDTGIEKLFLGKLRTIITNAGN